LRLEGVEKVKDAEIIKEFEDKLISTGKIPARFLRSLNDIMKAKKDYDAKKLTKQEVEKTKQEAGGIIKHVVEFMQRNRGRELERAKIRVKHGNTFGEVLLLQDTAFIIHDLDNEARELSKAKINPDGSLGTTSKATMEEFEQHLAKVEIPPKVFIKEKIFEDLKKLFGKDVEILVNY